MPRFCTCLSIGIAGLLLSAHACFAQVARPSENLFPDTTKGFVVIASMDQLTEQFNKTQIGQLMADPVMAPFTEDLQRQFDERWSGVRERLGIKWEDLRSIAGGETALGLILLDPNQAALAMVVDTAEREKNAEELLQRIATSLTRDGSTRSEMNVAETKAVVIRFDHPKPKDNPDAPPKKTFYCTTNKMLCVSDNLSVLRGILARTAADRGDSLADVKGFQVVRGRCARDLAGAMPQIRWFIHPLGYIEAIRAATPEEDRRKEKSSVFKVLRNQGFEAIQGVGGFVDFATEQFEIVHRSAVYAPKPWDKAMKMLVFPNGKDFAPQRFVPRDIASYHTFYADIVNAFDNFAPLFDELVGEEGSWKDVLEQLEIDKNGPQINLREELVTYLGPRVTVVTDYKLPITPSSERLLIVIEIKNEEAVKKAVQKTLQNDTDIKRHEIDGLIIWEMIDKPVKKPKLEISGPWAPPGAEVPAVEEDEDVRLLPHAAITVSHGQLFVASHLDFLLKVLKPREEHDTLTRSIDYRRVDATIENLNIPQKCARMFSRTDEEYRPTYELIRQGKMPESETVLGRVLNGMFGEGKKGQPRKQQVDGKEMPDFDVVRRHLGPAGTVVVSEGDDSWFIKGFLLKKE